MPIHRRNIGMVFQNYALFPHMSVFKNIAFPLSMRKMPKDEIAERVADVLELVQLSGFENRLPSQVSGGQAQRIATARALAAQPPLILMDEPLGALDVKLRIEMQEQLRLLHRDLGVTVVYVTHDQDEAMTLSDRIAVMRDGRIEQVGTPREVYEHPSNSFVASFLGDANLIESRVVQVSKERVEVTTLAQPSIRLYAPGRDASPLQREDDGGGDGHAFLMIRPQRVDLEAEESHGASSMGDSNQYNTLSATVKAAYFSGTQLRYLILTDQGDSLYAVSLISEGASEFEVGDRVTARWPVKFTRLLWE